MATIVGVSGSLRSGSYNAALLRAAADSMPAGARLEIASIKEIPLYDWDVETTSGLPAAVTALSVLPMLLIPTTTTFGLVCGRSVCGSSACSRSLGIFSSAST